MNNPGETLNHQTRRLTRLSFDQLQTNRPRIYRPVILALAVSIIVIYPMKGVHANPDESIEEVLEVVDQALSATDQDDDLEPSLNVISDSRPEVPSHLSPESSVNLAAEASAAEALSNAAPNDRSDLALDSSAQDLSDLPLDSSLSPALELSQADSPEPSPAFGSRGDQRWYVQAGGATTFDNNFGMLGAGISHFFANGHSINLELNGMAFEQTGEDAVGLNLALLLRWHFVRQPNWSLYIDGGAGILGTTNNVPSTGSSFNFTPQAGGGATVRLNDRRRLMVGLRWHHISNAEIYDGNPGRDSILGYVGVNFPR
jgi:hypothetical protein